MDGPLVGAEIHGFRTLRELDVASTMQEAATRWLRPNEIHAMLCNYTYFTVLAKPVNLPESGRIVLFDRKVLRNFRKDGHNWKKKKDGKTVKEAHEHLKVGNEERIHVYYAHGQDNPTFVRRCYWLLDKTQDHIVLVHYRETQELVQNIPSTPVNSNSNSSSASNPPGPSLTYEEFDSGSTMPYYTTGIEPSASRDGSTVSHHEQNLHDINTLDWDDLLMNDQSHLIPSNEENIPSLNLQNQAGGNGFLSGAGVNLSNMSSFNNQPCPVAESVYVPIMEGGQTTYYGVTGGGGVLPANVLQSQDSLGKWVEGMINESQGSIGSTVSPHQLQTPVTNQIFTITDVSPEWAYSNEKTKILVTGFFPEQNSNQGKSNLLCVIGDTIVNADIVQPGVYRCFVFLNSPGSYNMFMSNNDQLQISQFVCFECRSRSHTANTQIAPPESEPKWDEIKLQARLAHLLFSSPTSLDIRSGKGSPNALKEAKKFVTKTSELPNKWVALMKLIEAGKTTFPIAKDNLFRIMLHDRLKEWLLERLVEGSKSKEFDVQGQGVIHLCAMLGYTWAIQLFSLSGLSLDFRDKKGWTALHWAAKVGNKKMAGVLLSAGAKPNLVTDPDPANPGGLTAGDIAYSTGDEGLSAYLSERALVEQLNDMSVAGNVSGTLDTTTTTAANPESLSEDGYLKDSLAAYRTAADAAARIHVAFRERSFKLRTKAVEFFNAEDEARSIVAAMKIQHAFRNFDTRKKITAAAHIQHRFRTWKMRRQFLNLRKQTIRIQAAFRGFQVRRQYKKIIWSVGVVEKVILRWRLKRKGFRGLQVAPAEATSDQERESDTEEDFYKTSQKQAEERVERSVVRVQALFRSKKAQEEYQLMKLAHREGNLAFNDLLDPDFDMNS